MPKLIQIITFFVISIIVQASCNLVNTEPQCFVAGECFESYFIGEKPVSSETQCVKTCLENPSCLWWTFYPDISACALFENCNNLVIIINFKISEKNLDIITLGNMINEINYPTIAGAFLNNAIIKDKIPKQVFKGIEMCRTNGILTYNGIDR